MRLLLSPTPCQLAPLRHASRQTSSCSAISPTSASGSAVYNFAHTYITPGILLAIAYLTVKPQLFPLALIWTAHIGFDRLLGFGLKYPSTSKTPTYNTV